MRNAYLHSTGSSLPQRVVPNAYFNELLGEDVDTWLQENLTIRERRWLSEGESVADLCESAAQQALHYGGIRADEIDLLIIATDTPEFISPSTASIVQHRCGMTRAGTFDVNTACAGFVTALDIATKYIRSDEHYNTVMIIGAYGMSRYLDMHDKKTVTLFADGAGCAIVKSTHDDRGYRASMLETRGEYNEWMGIYTGATKYPVTPERVAHGDHFLKFVKKFPKELNPDMWTRFIATLADRAGITPQDITHFFMTQININSIHETLDRLSIPRERSYNIMHKYAYTGSAAIGIAFDEAVREGKVQQGDVCCFIGSGGGLAFAGSLFTL
jgi:3-oxoacyl-[acyl-carrier-protein] synthase-3